MPRSDVELRLLVHAPRGRDASVVETVLAGQGMRTHICPTQASLLEALHEGAAGAIVTAPLVEREHGAGLAIAGRGREVAPPDELVGKLEPQRGRLSPELLQANRARDGVLGSREMRDPPVSERVQVRERQADALRVIGADVRRMWALASDVDAHQRHLT